MIDHLTVAIYCSIVTVQQFKSTRPNVSRHWQVYRPHARLIGLYYQTYIIGLHQTRVPGFEGRQTRKPGFEKYPPGLHSLWQAKVKQTSGPQTVKTHSKSFFAFYTFSHLHFSDSISHFIRCPFSHFRILYVPLRAYVIALQTNTTLKDDKEHNLHERQDIHNATTELDDDP